MNVFASKPLKNERCDVLVIGSGGAGLRSAIAAAAGGAGVLVASKARAGRATNTYLSKAVIASSGWGDHRDNSRVHARDTMLGGRHLNHPDMVARFSETIPSETALLREWGVRFLSGEDGRPSVLKIPGHRFPRHLVGEHWNGSDLILPLKRKAEKSGVRFLERVHVSSLLVSDGRVCGAFCVSEESGCTVVAAGAVILATGGFGRLFLNTNNAPGITGDGHALAVRLGVPLQDMEFVQYYPTCLGRYGRSILLYEKILAQDGVTLKNSRGENILAGNGSGAHDLTRDQLAQLIMNAILEDPDGAGTVNLDLAGLSPEAAASLSGLIPARFFQGVKVFPVTPTTHFCMGGVKVDRHGETEMPGLFAVGEVTVGAHGANRLGGNALAEIIAMGSLVGSAAAEAVKAPKPAGLDAAAEHEENRLESLLRQSGADPREPTRDLREIMWLNAGIVRSRQSLEQALDRIMGFKDVAPRVTTPGDLIRCLEFRNLCLVGEIVCRSALERMESRGSHFRSDYPRENDEDWLVNLEVRKTDSGLALKKVPAGGRSQTE